MCVFFRVSYCNKYQRKQEEDEKNEQTRVHMSRSTGSGQGVFEEADDFGKDQEEDPDVPPSCPWPLQELCAGPCGMLHQTPLPCGISAARLLMHPVFLVVFFRNSLCMLVPSSAT